MALCTDKTLFVHVPKTGGSSVRAMIAAGGLRAYETGGVPRERWLQPHGGWVSQHFSILELRAEYPKDVEGRVSFGFIRHPVSWLVSRWAWAVKTGFSAKIARERAASANWMAHCWSHDFDEFARNYLDRYPGICTQTTFTILGLWTEHRVQRIGRTESLLDDLCLILSAAGEQFDRAAMAEVPRLRATEAAVFVRPRLRSAIERAEEPLCGIGGY